MITKLVGVAVAGALLLVAVDLADEAVQVDHQRQITGAGARSPGTSERHVQDTVELADMHRS